eukprot:TRINITY_DN66349_c0_g1_i1.p1 TRINITY_DN66349_c0_g1~~TRINITY_DN66349_c0_g1_i1.p1  ORF type:complete len:411 (+),score=51.84 TRINITY_DN66349_c0_g1_i1:101-1333(+)
MHSPSSKERIQVPSKVGGVYQLKKMLGKGCFGEVYRVVNIETGKQYAVKLERRTNRRPTLPNESRILRELQGPPGFATTHYFGQEAAYHALVVDLLGPSLEALLAMCHGKFSLKCTVMLAIQLIYRIELLHSIGYVHRDLKPENLLIGRRAKSNVLYIVDFGLAKHFMDPKTRAHIPYRDGKKLTGTARYSSINTHLGVEQSRRDDLESIGYVLIYLANGRLPWQGVVGTTKEEKYRHILECKQNMSIRTLCQGLPMVFQDYMNYCRALRFEDKPDYPFLRRMWKDMCTRKGYVNDAMFDWFEPCVEMNSEAPAVSPTSDVAGQAAEEKEEVAAAEQPAKRISIQDDSSLVSIGGDKSPGVVEGAKLPFQENEPAPSLEVAFGRSSYVESDEAGGSGRDSAEKVCIKISL